MSQVEKILTKIESIVENANKTNSSNDKDTGTNDKRDEIIYDGEWVYKDVYPKFKLKDDTPEFSYHLLHYLNNIKKDNALIVLPGFSNKSRDWTFGRINRWIKQMGEFQVYSDIIIFDFNEIKKLINEQNFGEGAMKNFYSEKIDHKISMHLNHILNKLDFKNVNLIGRSAGAGVAMVLSSLNKGVSRLSLACPGWNEGTINPLIEKINNGKKIMINIYHSKKDTRIKPEETKELSLLLEKNSINHVYEELDINEIRGHAFHHRIYDKLIYDLFK